MRLVQITVAEPDYTDPRKLPGEVLIWRGTVEAKLGSWKSCGEHVYTRRGYAAVKVCGSAMQIDANGELLWVDTSPAHGWGLVISGGDHLKQSAVHQLPTAPEMSVGLCDGVVLCRGVAPVISDGYFTFKVLLKGVGMSVVPRLRGARQRQPWDYTSLGVERKGTYGEVKGSWGNDNRGCGISASEFGKAVGVDGRVRDYLEGKCCVGLDETLSFSGNTATRHGVASESHARDIYSEHLGVEVRDGGFWVSANPEYAMFGASPDGCVHSKGSAHPDRLLEIKCPLYGYPNHAKWDAQYKGVDPKYFCQVQGQLHMVNVGVCDFFMWDIASGTWCMWRIKRDRACWEALLSSLCATQSYVAGEEWFTSSSQDTLALTLSPGTIIPLLPPPSTSPAYSVFHLTHVTIISATAAATMVLTTLVNQPTMFSQLFSTFLRPFATVCSYVLSLGVGKRQRQVEELEEDTTAAKRRKL